MAAHPPPHLLAALAVVLATSSIFGPPSTAAEPADATVDPVGLELFEKHVRPTLVEQCIRCHGEKKQQGGLRLDSREGWMEGGDSGAAIVPGQPDESLFVQAVRYTNNDLEMPPKGVLPQATIAAIEQWVRLGAPDPRTMQPTDGDSASPSSAPPTVEQGRSFWAFQPVQPASPPAVHNDAWPRTDIDRFVLAKLEHNKLTPAADAAPLDLVRRVYFDLLGLPPTPAEIDRFVNDPSPSAYADLVDRLLDSPQFGEHWGRHWLSVVRYAQSSGGGRTLLFPDAWRYRDYVIDSFNQDVPYDQFVREQLAGDLLEYEDWRDRRRKLIATAFLLLGPTNYELQDKDILEMDVVDEQLDTFGKSVLGMTLGCARCHDHKFDPIPTHDYYALAGIFKSTKAMIHSNVSQWNTVDLPLDPQQAAALQQQQQELADARSQLAAATKAWVDAGGMPSEPKGKQVRSIDRQSIQGLVVDDDQAESIGEWMESTSQPGFVGRRYLHDSAAEPGKKRVVYRPQLPHSGRYEVRLSYPAGPNRSTRAQVHIVHRDGEATVSVNQRNAPELDGKLSSLGVFAFDVDGDNPPRVTISNEGKQDGVVIADAVVFVSLKTKGEDALAEKPEADLIDADAMAALEKLKQQVDTLKAHVQTLEKALPKAAKVMATVDDDDAGDIPIAIRGVVHNKGPLTPRGTLQVASHEPFPAIPEGQSGRGELADWTCSPHNPLTSRVIVNRVWQWTMGRGLVSTVDNFGSMGQPPTHPELLDYLATSFVENDWSIKTLIRQILLSRTYQLQTLSSVQANPADPDNQLLSHAHRKRLHAEQIRDALLAISGKLDATKAGPNLRGGTSSEYGYQFTSTRRSVYVPVFRNRLPQLFEVFDFPDPNIQSGSRNVSTIASQALLLMNHPFVIEQSQTAAERLLQMDLADDASRIDYAYRQVIGRPPTAEELSVMSKFIDGQADGSKPQAVWTILYQTLFQSIDFRHLN